jgi:hypothetical protein
MAQLMFDRKDHKEMLTRRREGGYSPLPLWERGWERGDNTIRWAKQSAPTEQPEQSPALLSAK